MTANRTKTVIAIAIFLVSLVWYGIALSDALTQTSLAAQSGLSFAWSVPTNSILFLAFYVLTTAGIVAMIAWPRLRRRFFEEPASPRLPNPSGGRLRQAWNYLLPLSPLELALIVLVSVGMIGLRFVMYPFPQGSDTPQYVEAANRVFLGLDVGQMFPPTRLGTGRTLTVAFVVVVRAFIGLFYPAADVLTAMVIPFLLTILYSLAVTCFLHLLTHGVKLAFWGGVIAPASFMTIRLSYDLFAQFLGLSISVVAVALFLNYLSRREGPSPFGRFEGGIVASFFVLGVLAHMWTWAILLLLSIALVGWMMFAAPHVLRRTLIRATVALSPSIALMAVLLSISSFVRYTVAYPISVGAFSPFSFPAGWDWVAGWESAFVWLFAIIGFVALLAGRSTVLVRAVVLLWAAMISALIFVLGFGDPVRLIIMYPVPFLVVFGLQEVRQRLTLKAPRLRLQQTQTDFAVAVGLTVLLVATVIPTTYIASYTYWPGQATYNQLRLIEQGYGFSNSSVVILTDHAFFETGFQWSSAITGDQIYSGCLLCLLRGDPFEREHLRWVFPDLSNVSEILVPSMLYTPDVLERQILIPGPLPGVFIYQMNRRFQPDVLFTNTTLPLATTYAQNWTLSTSTMNHTFSASTTGLNWSWPAVSPSQGGQWFTYDRPLPNGTEQSLYILAGGSLGQANGAVQVFYADQSVTSYSLGDMLTRPSLIRISLQNDEPHAGVRVTFFVYPGNTASPGWFDISFMALVGG